MRIIKLKSLKWVGGGEMKSKGLVFVVMIFAVSFFLMPLACAIQKNSSHRSEEQILAEAKNLIQAKNQLLATMKPACDELCSQSLCECRQDVKAVELEVTELTLRYCDVWNQKYSTDPEYLLGYYWDPKNIDSRNGLKEFLYVLADPKLEEKNKISVALISKGGWDELFPQLTNVFYDLREEIPDLENFLKDIHLQLMTEQCGITMPEGSDLPTLSLLSGLSEDCSSRIDFHSQSIPWTRETDTTRNSISALLILVEEQEP